MHNGRTNTTGVVSGAENGLLSLTQFSQTSDIHVGDQLVTTGSKDNQPYVPDVPVGVVTSVDNTPGAATHTAVVRPWADFNNLDLVAVIFPPHRSRCRAASWSGCRPWDRRRLRTPTSPSSTSSRPPSTSGTPTTGGTPTPGKSGHPGDGSSPPATPKP